ncbi:hypothetical protein BGP_1381 [Beggiatoa sp. PS]|nr:hypothetical protein BGP_1381 [Beggiatoa sp. PS]
MADSSALVALATCGSLWVLKELCHEVKVPQAVSIVFQIKEQTRSFTPISGL